MPVNRDNLIQEPSQKSSLNQEQEYPIEILAKIPKKGVSSPYLAYLLGITEKQLEHWRLRAILPSNSPHANLLPQLVPPTRRGGVWKLKS